MFIWIGLTVLCIVCWILFVRGNELFVGEGPGVAVLVVLIVILIVAFPVMIAERISGLGKLAEYDAFNRTFVQVENPQEREDIIGQVAKWNEDIARWKRLNRIHFIDPFIIDELVELEEIRIKK